MRQGKLIFAAATMALILAVSAFGADAPSVGPTRGSLLIVGGGTIGPEIAARFIALAGGPGSEFVVIPTATDSETFDVAQRRQRWIKTFGNLKHVTMLHTRDRGEADSETFVAPLKTARAVWKWPAANSQT